MADISDASWSETDGSNTNAPPLGWPAGMAPNQVEPTERAAMGAIKRFWDRINGTITTTGAAGIYVWTPANVAFPVVLTQGETYSFKAHQIGIGGDTLNINGLGAKPLYKPGGGGPVALEQGDIQTGSLYSAAYDSALGGTGAFQLISGTIPSAVRGKVNGGNAASGIVGEYISSVVLIGSEVNINTPGANVATITLTAGDWDIDAELWVDTATGSAASSGTLNAAITTVSATLPSGPSDGTSLNHYNSAPITSTTFAFVVPVGPTRLITAAASTPVYLFGRGAVTSGTLFGYGILRARRMR